MHFVLHCGSYATIRAKYSTLFQSAHCQGEGDAQVLQYLFKQGNQLELAYCLREMMEHRRKQMATGRGVEIEGEVLAKVWEEKVLDAFDHQDEEVSVGGACETCPITLPENI